MAVFHTLTLFSLHRLKYLRAAKNNCTLGATGDSWLHDSKPVQTISKIAETRLRI